MGLTEMLLYPVGSDLRIHASTCQSHMFRYANPPGEMEHLLLICPSPEPLPRSLFAFVIYKERNQEAFSASDAFFFPTRVVALLLLAV